MSTGGGGKIYVFRSFKCPQSCILKQPQISFGGLLKISKVLINKQKTTITTMNLFCCS